MDASIPEELWTALEEAELIPKASDT